MQPLKQTIKQPTGTRPGLQSLNQRTKGEFVMANQEIRHRVSIKASPDTIYQALTDVKKLAQWWTTDTRGESKTGKTLEFWCLNTRSADSLSSMPISVVAACWADSGSAMVMARVAVSNLGAIFICGFMAFSYLLFLSR
jgi:hypothetical protein